MCVCSGNTGSGACGGSTVTGGDNDNTGAGVDGNTGAGSGRCSGMLSLRPTLQN